MLLQGHLIISTLNGQSYSRASVGVSACRVTVCVCLQAFITVSVQGSVKTCQITGFVFISLKDFSGLAKVRGHPTWRRVGFGTGCFPPSARLKIRAGLRKGRTCREQLSVVGIVTHKQK